MRRIRTAAAVSIAIAVAAIGASAAGSSGGFVTPTVYAPTGPIVQYATRGASNRTTRDGDLGSRSTAAPVVFSTPPGGKRYDALVTVSAQYHVVGHGLFYLELDLPSARHHSGPRVYPARRLVSSSKADSSTSMTFWVKGLASGKKYELTPEVSGPSRASSYINTYYVLTRIELFPTG